SHGAGVDGMTNFSGKPIASQTANAAGAVSEASAGYFAHPAGEGLNPVQGGVVYPPGYKQTEVGVIPEDWDAIKMGDLAKIQRGASPRPIDSPIWFERNS